MDPAVVALASSGATTLVGVMVTDAWVQARGRFARWFGGADPQAVDAAGEELDACREELVAAQAAGELEVAQDVEAEWRGRLRRRLAADPEARAELRALVEELSPGASVVGDDGVANSVTGGSQQTVIQGRDFSDVTFNSAVLTPPYGPHNTR
ncbi:hypothetical protein [Yinghuangia sp. YIM S09857]|uniref:hypothetical protein n=1 Tax=Yinghuangia sp. YIM S09857 TaxID=3436929 RepID=UPI003F52D777